METQEKLENKEVGIRQTTVDLIGSTPLVKLTGITSDQAATVYGKLEARNPGGSVKDRIGLSMIEAAERDGKIKEGTTIIEPTSGNTGISLAIVAAVKGYKCVLTMPESMSIERRALLCGFGTKLVLTPAADGMTGAINKAQQLKDENPDFFMPQQFENPANPEVHRKTTAVEILEAMHGKSIDAFVAGVGTGGTITGVGEVLKGLDSKIQVIAVEPADSPVLSGGESGPHKIQGIGAGFIPKVLNTSVLDEVITVTNEEAFDMRSHIAQKQGMIVGISSGAAIVAAAGVAEEIGKGHNVVTILPDTGERYLSMT